MSHIEFKEYGDTERQSRQLPKATHQCLAPLVTTEHLIDRAESIVGQMQGCVSEQQRQVLFLLYPDFHERLARVYHLLLAIAERHGGVPDGASGCRDKEG